MLFKIHWPYPIVQIVILIIQIIIPSSDETDGLNL
jgi:hypothetical protein